jgi:hypothetical protein
MVFLSETILSFEETIMADRDEERGFFGRAADEVRTWFGEEQAARRGSGEYGAPPSPRHGDMWRDDEPRSGQRNAGESARSYGRSYGGSTGQGAQSWGQAQDEPGFGDYGAERGGRSTGQGYGREHGTGGFHGDYRAGQGHGGFGGHGDWEGGRQSASSGGQRHHDPHYLDWRNRQIEELDRDYDEYNRERQQRFHEDFSSWRSNRQGQGGTGASTRAEETGRPSDMARGNAGVPTSGQQAGGKYAGEPGPAGMRGENHMDPLKVDENADPSKA